jgi:hypothetical protein
MRRTVTIFVVLALSGSCAAYDLRDDVDVNACLIFDGKQANIQWSITNRTSRKIESLEEAMPWAPSSWGARLEWSAHGRKAQPVVPMGSGRRVIVIDPGKTVEGVTTLDDYFVAPAGGLIKDTDSIVWTYRMALPSAVREFSGVLTSSSVCTER